MISNELLIVISILTVIFLYPVVHFLLQRRLQPLRMRLFDLGDRLLDSKDLSERDARIVFSMMKDAYSWKVAASIAIFIPVYALVSLKGQRKKESFAAYEGKTRDSLKQFIGLFITSAMGACPPAALAIMLMVMITVPVLLVRGQLSKLGSIQSNILWFSEARLHRS